MPLEIRKAYEIMGLTFGASIKEINEQYRKLSRILHPDTVRRQFPTATEEEIAQKIKERAEQFKELNEANQLLLNPPKVVSFSAGTNTRFDPFAQFFHGRPTDDIFKNFFSTTSTTPRTSNTTGTNFRPTSGKQKTHEVKFNIAAQSYSKKGLYIVNMSFQSEKGMDFTALKKGISTLEFNVKLTIHNCKLTDADVDDLLTTLEANKEITEIDHKNCEGLSDAQRAKLNDIVKKHKKDEFHFFAQYHDNKGTYLDGISFQSRKGMDFSALKAGISALKFNVRLTIYNCKLTDADFDDLLTTLEANNEITEIDHKNCEGLSDAQRVKLNDIIEKHKKDYPKKEEFVFFAQYNDNTGSYFGSASFQSREGMDFSALKAGISALKFNVRLTIYNCKLTDANFDDLLTTLETNKEISEIDNFESLSDAQRAKLKDIVEKHKQENSKFEMSASFQSGRYFSIVEKGTYCSTRGVHVTLLKNRLRNLKYNVNLTFNDCRFSATDFADLLVIIASNPEIIAVEFDSVKCGLSENQKNKLIEISQKNKKAKGEYYITAHYYDNSSKSSLSRHYNSNNAINDFSNLKQSLKELRKDVKLDFYSCQLPDNLFAKLIVILKRNPELTQVTFSQNCELSNEKQKILEKIAEKSRNRLVKDKQYESSYKWRYGVLGGLVGVAFSHYFALGYLAYLAIVTVISFTSYQYGKFKFCSLKDSSEGCANKEVVDKLDEKEKCAFYSGVKAASWKGYVTSYFDFKSYRNQKTFSAGMYCAMTEKEKWQRRCTK